MKLVVCSDLHLDWVTMGVPRFDEVSRAFRKAVDAACDWRADLFLCCGDVCDPDSGAVVLRCAMGIIWAAQRLRNHHVQSVWICGNHDVAGDGKTTSLDPLLGMGSGVDVVKDGPRSMYLPDSWELIGLPYPSSPKGWDCGLETHYRPDPLRVPRKRIVAGHLSIEGVQPGEESDEMSRGKDVFFPTEEVKKLNPRFTCNGHYHRRQVTKEGIQIVGSLARLTFGAEEHEPGFLKVELD